MRKTIHSSREERNADEAATRCNDVSARASMASQKDVKNCERGCDVSEGEDIRICIVIDEQRNDLLATNTYR